MENKLIITIGRQYGSGGRYVGRLISDILSCPFYDKEILEIAARESGIKEDLFINADENRTGSFWNTLPIGTGGYWNRHSPIGDMPMNNKLFLIQSDIIKKIADQGPCVIVGRCADYILKDDPNTIRVFIHCPLYDRLDRITKYYDIADEDAESIVSKTDKMRASYYEFHTGAKWGVAENYHLSVDSSVLDIEGTAELIKNFAFAKLQKI